MKKVVICGGHLTPALALIEKLKNKKGIKVIFYGRKYATEGSKSISAEYKIITAKKVKFHVVNAGKLQRKFTKYTIWALLKIPVGFIQCFYYLIVERPSVVVSFGGYLSLPAVFCAWILRIKSITHEQSSRPGIANIVNSYFADQILVAWPQTKNYFKNKKVLTIGNPMRSDIYIKETTSRTISDFINGPGSLLFITGGNQGSHFINTLVFSLKDSLSNFRILHQVGTANHKQDLDKAFQIKAQNYLAVEYLKGADYGAAMNKASIIIARSGANTTWELATLAKPSILIPLGISASNEQAENAKILGEAGSAIVLKQSKTTKDHLEEGISKIKNNYGDYLKNARLLSRRIPKNGSQKLADIVLKYTQ